MAATTIVTQGPSPGDDYGLDAIAKHNADDQNETDANVLTLNPSLTLMLK